MTPSNENELWKMLNTGYSISGPVAVRYPRGSGPGIEIENTNETLEIGKANLVKNTHSEVTILSFGAMLELAIEVSNEIDCSVVDMRYVKPLDEKLISLLSKIN